LRSFAHPNSADTRLLDVLCGVIYPMDHPGPLREV